MTAAKSERIQLSGASWVDKFRAPRELVPPGPLGTSLVDRLWVLRPPERGSVRIMGRTVQVPRWQQSYGRAYTFSGQTLGGGPVPPELQPYLDWANSLPQYGGRFDEILLNWYENGQHCIGKHHDDETQLIQGAPIISISLGAERTFRIRATSGERRRDIAMPHGTVLVMGGAMQKEFSHEVPKIDGEKGKWVGRRINVTLRQFKTAASSAGGGRGSEAGGPSSSRGGDGLPPSKRQRTAAAG
ncbi:hypothetical protein ABPG75_010700 [Micractinium tetrahymenae]